MPPPEASASPHPLSGLLRVCDAVEAALGWLAGIGLAAFVVTVAVDVVYREILHRPMLAPSEISVCLFIWSTLLAAAVAARRKSHFVMDFLPASLSPRISFALDVLASVLAVVFALVLTCYGYGMASRGYLRVSPMSGFSMLWFYTALPVSGAAFLLFALEALARLVAGGPKGDRA